MSQITRRKKRKAKKEKPKVGGTKSVQCKKCNSLTPSRGLAALLGVCCKCLRKRHKNRLKQSKQGKGKGKLKLRTGKKGA